MSETAYSNINVIAGTLKLYLRLLPIPLITFQSYPDFLEATKKNSEEEMIAALKESTKSLPQPHLNCLKYIIQHLNRWVKKTKLSIYKLHCLITTLFILIYIFTGLHHSKISIKCPNTIWQLFLHQHSLELVRIHKI